MCLDPLGVAQLQISEVIEILATELMRPDATLDPGVAEAVRARLEMASAKLREVQAGFSRETAKRVTRDVLIDIGMLIVEMMIRASATHCNSFHDHQPQDRYATRLNHPSLPTREWPFAGRTRGPRRHHIIIPFTPRARQTRTHAARAATYR